MATPQPLEKTIARRISRRKANVFLRSDFEDLGGYDQVGRALRCLVRKGQLVKVGYGLYTRAQLSPFTGEPAPRVGIKRLAEEALCRLKVETGPTRMEQEYNSGKSTQIPTGRVVGVKKRVRRKIVVGMVKVRFERVR